MSTVDDSRRESVITEGMLDDLRQKIGKPLQIASPPHMTELTTDGIRHWAWGIGDRSPLWSDPSYAQSTRYGDVIGVPTMILAFSRLATGHQGGMPGIHALYAGSDYTWSSYLRRGTNLTADVTLESVEPKQTRYAGLAYDQTTRITFRDDIGDVIAVGRSSVFRTERRKGHSRRRYAKLRPHSYTEAELDAIHEAVDGEFIRGATDLHWEDVSIGDEIPVIVRGPLTISDNVSFAFAWGGSFLRAHGMARDYRRRHPAAEIRNAYGLPDFPECVHWDAPYAESIGLAAPYDYGAQRFAWMGNAVTNWMGDNGFLRRLKVQFRRFNLIGDTTWCGGRVVGTRVDVECGALAPAHAVDLELTGRDQRGEVTTTGLATVFLPSRTGAAVATGREGSIAA